MGTTIQPTRTIALVARREFLARVRSKSYLVSNAIVLAVLVLGTLGVSLFGGDDEVLEVGLVGDARNLAAPIVEAADAFDVDVTPVEIADEDEARRRIAEDTAVALLPGEGQNVTALTESSISSELRAVLDTAVQQRAVAEALRAEGLDPAALGEATAGAAVVVEALDPPDPDATERTFLAYVAVLVLFVQVFVFGLYVAMGVVEEKSSRVVELLLSTIRPLHLLAGKVIGIGTVGLLQLVVYGVVGLTVGTATGLLTLTGTAVAVFASTVGWFVLGFAFFAVLYAAAGSLVSRQEDVNAVSTPINGLAFSLLLLGQFALSDPERTLVEVMSWIPPFSASLMPLRIAAGVAEPFQIVGTVVLMLVVTVALTVLAARIYQRSVLNTRSQPSLRSVLRR